MGESQRVSELVGRRLKQVGSLEVLVCPVLAVVEVGIAAVDGKEGVGEGPALTVEGIPVTVGALLEPYREKDLQ